MIAKNRTYRHLSGTTHFRERTDRGDIWISQKTAAYARRLAIHLQDRQFFRCRQVIDVAEEEHRLSQLVPESLDGVALGELSLPGHVYEALDDSPNIHNAGDLMALRDDELLELPGIGPKGVATIRQRCNHWLGRTAKRLQSA